jgi:hypothetical protein
LCICRAGRAVDRHDPVGLGTVGLGTVGPDRVAFAQVPCAPDAVGNNGNPVLETLARDSDRAIVADAGQTRDISDVQ